MFLKLFLKYLVSFNNTHDMLGSPKGLCVYWQTTVAFWILSLQLSVLLIRVWLASFAKYGRLISSIAQKLCVM